jgi:hypothetical protein
MATILLTWELGGGLGHVTVMRPVAQRLAERGHRCLVALKSIQHGEAVFAPLGIPYLQAPVKNWNTPGTLAAPISFAHVLHGQGYANAEELTVLAKGWRRLIESVRPDALVCNYSPTALLASRGMSLRRVVVGTGFECPPNVAPLPAIRRPPPDKLDLLARDEQRVLETVNAVARSLGAPPLERLAELFYQSDAQLLTTLAELDHFGPREGGDYYGTWADDIGIVPEWPPGDGPRLFGYLKPVRELPLTLEALRERSVRAVLFVPGIDPPLAQRFASDRLRFSPRPLRLGEVARQCDLALLNATHGTTSTMLLAGAPVASLPIFVEQNLVAACVARLGAGLAARRDKPQQIASTLDAMLVGGTYRRAAQAFATRYAGYDAAAQLSRLVDRIERVIAG